jgi:hypothetical protein
MITINIDREFMRMFVLSLCTLWATIYVIMPILYWLITKFINLVYKPFYEILIGKNKRAKAVKEYLKECYPKGQDCIWCNTNNERVIHGQKCSKCEALL